MHVSILALVLPSLGLLLLPFLLSILSSLILLFPLLLLLLLLPFLGLSFSLCLEFLVLFLDFGLPPCACPPSSGPAYSEC